MNWKRKFEVRCKNMLNELRKLQVISTKDYQEVKISSKISRTSGLMLVKYLNRKRISMIYNNAWLRKPQVVIYPQRLLEKGNPPQKSNILVASSKS